MWYPHYSYIRCQYLASNSTADSKHAVVTTLFKGDDPSLIICSHDENF